MKSVLICPGERSAVGFLALSTPLALLPVCGETLLSYWLQHLAKSGVTRVSILAADRPDQVRALIGTGARWGLSAEVIREMRELTPEEANAKYGESSGGDSGSSQVHLLDHLPGMDGPSLFGSYANWFSGVLNWLPRVPETSRIGVKEIEPGVWIGLNSHAAPGAKLHPPCWLGENVRVGDDSVIGPQAVIENGVVIEGASEITQSIVGPETFVGRFIQINHSLAWGSLLIDWTTSSCTTVPDPFLMCPLAQDPSASLPKRFFGGLLSRLSRPLEWVGLGGKSGR